MDLCMDYISRFAVSSDAILGAVAGMTPFLNCHKHGDNLTDDEVAVFNCYPGQVADFNRQMIGHVTATDFYVSCGLHPWYIHDNWREEIDVMRDEVSMDKVVAVGECGLDKTVSTSLDLQKEIFIEQVSVSEQIGKPVIIHCVKAFDELLAVHKYMAPRQRWLIHGFRGKPEQAKQLMAKGMLLSFGHQYNVSTLLYVLSTTKSLFLETDASHLSIRHVYDQIACHLSR